MLPVLETEVPLSVQQQMDVSLHQGLLKPMAQGILQTFPLVKMQPRSTTKQSTYSPDLQV